ncbi:hypothetical protein ACFOZY_03150 [Chungangia koreensis]|uniref:Uncharacterized protein n=1 Tax=Chungangia koreensis TaxID=752657 RepID=A0ABV8X5T7_9LACT
MDKSVIQQEVLRTMLKNGYDIRGAYGVIPEEIISKVKREYQNRLMEGYNKKVNSINAKQTKSNITRALLNV